MDFTLITGALTGMKTIMDISKTLDDQKTISAINSAVAEVQIKLIQTQQQILEVQDENRALKEELSRLKEGKALEANVAFHDGAYWNKREDGKEDGPFCPSCWGLEKKLVLPSVSEVHNNMASLYCIHHGKDPRYFSVPVHLVHHLNAL